MILITLLLVWLNHVYENHFGHDAIVVDICIGIGYLMYMLL